MRIGPRSVFAMESVRRLQNDTNDVEYESSSIAGGVGISAEIPLVTSLMACKRSRVQVPHPPLASMGRS